MSNFLFLFFFVLVRSTSSSTDFVVNEIPNSVASCVIVLSDGALFAAGSSLSINDKTFDIVVASFLSDGTRDVSFGTSGPGVSVLNPSDNATVVAALQL
jgi:hypothetical protein